MLLTRAPLYRGRSPFSLDLHVLGAPLTFVLSQDQTLQLNLCRSALLRKGAPQLGHWRHCNPLVYSVMLWLFLLCHVDGLATSSAYAADEPGPTLLRDDSLFNPVFKDRGRSTSALPRSTSGLLPFRLAACGAYSSSGLRTLVPAIQLVKHFFSDVCFRTAHRRAAEPKPEQRVLLKMRGSVNEKRPAEAGLGKKIPATSYSPTKSPWQYHRR